MLGVRLPEELSQKIAHFSEQAHQSKSLFVKEALEEYLEDEYLYQEAVAAYEDYLRNGKQSVSWEEVQRKAGLLDHDKT